MNIIKKKEKKYLYKSKYIQIYIQIFLCKIMKGRKRKGMKEEEEYINFRDEEMEWKDRCAEGRGEPLESVNTVDWRIGSVVGGERRRMIGAGRHCHDSSHNRLNMQMYECAHHTRAFLPKFKHSPRHSLCRLINRDLEIERFNPPDKYSIVEIFVPWKDAFAVPFPREENINVF